jgi:two-component system, cell cycle sensor histidine kinase and response regulator CckA
MSVTVSGWRGRLRSLLKAPALADDDETRRAGVMNSLIMALLALLLVGGGLATATVFAMKAASALVITALGLVLFVALACLRRGRLQVAGRLLVGGLFVVFSALVAVSGGIHSVGIAYYVSLTVVAGVLLGHRAALATAALSVLFGVVLVACPILGHPLPRLFPVPPGAALIDLLLMLLLAMVPLTLALQGLAEALANAREQLRERRRTEEALRESESRFRTIFDSVNDAVLVQEGSSGGLFDVNRRALEMWGYSEKDGRLTAHQLCSGAAPYTEEELLLRMERARDDEPRLFEWHARHASGRLFWVEVNMRRAALHGGRRLLLTVRDITERKRAQEEQDRLSEQLLQAQKLESIGRLAGGVAHDFNNMLTGVIGHLSLALLTLEPTRQEHAWITTANQAALSAAELTTQLLAFSRRQIIEPRALCLNEVVRRMESMLTRTIGEDIALTTALAEDLDPTSADPNQLENVILNLAVNARDAMPLGGKLTIETANVMLGAQYGETHGEVRPGAYVMLAVTDTGCGMSADVKQRLFEPFFTTKPKGEGTGLGLAMVFGAVKQHGGAIQVYSEVGRGSTFKVYLPRAHTEAEALPQRDEPGSLPQGDETVVLVEDERVARDAISTVLRRLGYHVVVFENGEEALAGLRAHDGSVDLLLTDVVLPGMNGRALAERLQTRWPLLKVLYSSGYTRNVIVNHGVLEQGIEFLGKPFTPEALARKLRALLDPRP